GLTTDGPSATPDPQSPRITKLGLAPGVFVEPDAVSWTYTTARGPGGQNVNRRSTRAVLRLDLTRTELPERVLKRLLRKQARWVIDDGAALQIACEEHRSQSRNRQGCLDQLREALVVAQHIPKPRKKTKPSRGAVERRLQSKREQSERKARRGRVE
ncbi:MAG: aminoacyl-tRNA hydrolase, partial [Salinibacterium sp.]|nr:aminoacyl-tRNA hydrolase [Salinibacterium sp.]